MKKRKHNQKHKIKQCSIVLFLAGNTKTVNLTLWLNHGGPQDKQIYLVS